MSCDYQGCYHFRQGVAADRIFARPLVESRLQDDDDHGSDDSADGFKEMGYPVDHPLPKDETDCMPKTDHSKR